jgi:hypothetical protein
MDDTITSTVTFNQRNAQTVKDAERFVEMLLDETPAFAKGKFGMTWDGETVVMTISMLGRYMDDFISLMKLLTGNTPGVNGILHYMGVSLTERRVRGAQAERV